jgi:DNA-binding transcriptional LysR family regulator
LCVVEAGSFSKAAEQLYISAPAVIKQINSLEASLGMKLFDRTHRGLVVTEAGQSIYNDAATGICGSVATDPESISGYEV